MKHSDLPDKVTVNLTIADGDGDGISYITGLNNVRKIYLFNSYERLFGYSAILSIARIAPQGWSHTE